MAGTFDRRLCIYGLVAKIGDGKQVSKLTY